MGKYRDLQDAVFALFASVGWTDEDIKAFPVGFEGEKGVPPYIRVSILSSGADINTTRASGLLMIEIFTAWGGGPSSASEIADTLDSHFAKKILDGVQFFVSTLTQFERDRDNSGLGRAVYSIPFSLFGV